MMQEEKRRRKIIKKVLGLGIDFYIFIAVAVFSFVHLASNSMFESIAKSLTVAGTITGVLAFKKPLLSIFLFFFNRNKDTEGRKKAVFAAVFNISYTVAIAFLMFVFIPKLYLAKSSILLIALENTIAFSLIAALMLIDTMDRL